MNSEVKNERLVILFMVVVLSILGGSAVFLKTVILREEPPLASLVRVEEGTPPAEPVRLEMPDHDVRMMEKVEPESWSRLRAEGFDPDQTSPVTVPTK